MTILFNVLPLILVGTGAAILFWPRKPGPEPLDHEEDRKACTRLTWRRFLLATVFMGLAFVLAILGQNQAG